MLSTIASPRVNVTRRTRENVQALCLPTYGTTTLGGEVEETGERDNGDSRDASVVCAEKNLSVCGDHDMGTTVFDYEVSWGQDKRSITIGGHEAIPLSPTQRQLVVPLLSGRAMTYQELARNVYGCDADSHTRRMIDKNVERLRTKLRPSPLWVYHIRDYGFILLPRNREGVAAQL